MQTVDKFMLGVAAIWVLFMCYAVLLLLPFMDRKLKAWDMKIKRRRHPLPTPNYAQRVVFLLLTCLMTAVALTSAFHRNLSEMLGVTSWTPCELMLVLPAIYFALGWFGRSREDQPGRD